MTYVADPRRNFNTKLVLLGDDDAARGLDPPLALLHNIGTAGIGVILASARGILQGGELVLTAHLDAGELLQRRHGENVEDELLQLDTVGAGRLNGLATLRVDVGDLLAGNVVRQLVHPVLNRFEEVERVVVVNDVSSPELEQLRILGVLGLGGRLVNLRVLDHVGLAVLLHNQTYGLGSIALAHHLGGNVDVLGGGKSNKDGVGDLDETVVYAVGVDVLDAALAHVLAHARGDNGLVDTTVAVGSHSNLDDANKMG